MPALIDPADSDVLLRDMTGKWPCHADTVVQPRSTEEVSQIVRRARAENVTVVPQGGNTGLVGGCAVAADHRAVLLSLGRLNGIREIDPVSGVVVAEAGCILANLQAAVGEHGYTIPLGLGSEGSATIGGLISTNAGGIRALRHGVMRNQVLGLEVVLPDGRVWNGLRTVTKNNMGYDLKQLFIGGEGTLGVVTAAALRLVPAATQVETVWLAVASPASALTLLGVLRRAAGDLVAACELIERRGVEWAAGAVPALRPPDLADHGWFLLVEFASSGDLVPVRDIVEGALERVFESGLALEGMIAQTEMQRAELWRVREAIVDGKRAAAPSVSVDVAVPLGSMPVFLDAAARATEELLPGAQTLSFGHVGDGNIHWSAHRGTNDARTFEAVAHAIAAAVERLALDQGGSICAEHGVGRKMRDAVAAAVGPEELDLFGAVKRAIDPDNRMNPDALIALDDEPNR